MIAACNSTARMLKLSANRRLRTAPPEKATTRDEVLSGLCNKAGAEKQRSGVRAFFPHHPTTPCYVMTTINRTLSVDGRKLGRQKQVSFICQPIQIPLPGYRFAAWLCDSSPAARQKLGHHTLRRTFAGSGCGGSGRVQHRSAEACKLGATCHARYPRTWVDRRVLCNSAALHTCPSPTKLPELTHARLIDGLPWTGSASLSSNWPLC